MRGAAVVESVVPMARRFALFAVLLAVAACGDDAGDDGGRVGAPADEFAAAGDSNSQVPVGMVTTSEVGLAGIATVDANLNLPDPSGAKQRIEELVQRSGVRNDQLYLEGRAGKDTPDCLFGRPPALDSIRAEYQIGGEGEWMSGINFYRDRNGVVISCPELGSDPSTFAYVELIAVASDGTSTGASSCFTSKYDFPVCTSPDEWISVYLGSEAGAQSTTPTEIGPVRWATLPRQDDGFQTVMAVWAPDATFAVGLVVSLDGRTAEEIVSTTVSVIPEVLLGLETMAIDGVSFG